MSVFHRQVLNKMKVLVTGATGFTGSHTVPYLLEEDLDIYCFVRESSDLSCLPLGKVNLVYGDLDDKSSLNKALKKVDTLVNIASLGFGHAPGIIKAAVEEKINRVIFFSTTSIYTTLNPKSKKVRLDAEKRIKDSSLNFTILRPTMIYGSSRDRNICKFIRFINKSPIFPVFGSGDNKQQPVYVNDVAASVVNILRSDETIGKSYNISGGTVLTLNELVELIAKFLGNEIYRLHLPSKPMVKLFRFLEILSLPLPISSEQIQRLNEDKAFDHDRATRDFGYSPIPIENGLRNELLEMGLINGS